MTKSQEESNYTYDWKRMFHQQNLQINGIYVHKIKSYSATDNGKLFRLLRLRFSPENVQLEPVPIKLPIVPRNKTSYSMINGKLFYENEQLDFNNFIIERVPMVPEEDSWHMKGYTFPFQGTRNPYRELRINVRITGYCPGRCIFCHRWHSHRSKPDRRYQPDPDTVLDCLNENEGEFALHKVQQVMFISELFGHEGKFLSAVSDVREALAKRGYDNGQLFGCCAQDVRSANGLEKLKELVQPARYSFSLEVFDNRRELMGPYKGLSMEDVYKILDIARKVGFDEIQLNYLAGIDSLDACCHGFEELAKRGLVDSVGFSTYTTFSENQMKYRHPEAWEPSYYLKIVQNLASLGIKAYRPESFDFGSPYTVLMEKSN
jgi:hypothetical protein